MNVGNLISLASGLIIGIIIALIGWAVVSLTNLNNEVSELRQENAELHLGIVEVLDEVYFLQGMLYEDSECAGGFSHIKTRS